MSPPGRPRKQKLPPHIDAAKVPAGLYWDPAARRWYIKARREGGGTSTKRVASESAQLSELHAIAESLRSEDRASLAWLCKEFAKSADFKGLASGTRTDYEYCQGVLCSIPTKRGQSFGELAADRITRPAVQRLIDQLASTPSKAAHVRRYLSRVWEWGANRGYVPPVNPARGVDTPKERKLRRLPGPVAMAAIVRHAHACGQLGHGVAGGCPPYLWAVIELAYLCRLRGIEVVTLTEVAAEREGLRTNRRKGSRDNIVAWTPRLRAAWDFLIARRDRIWTARKLPVPLMLSQRAVVVAADGGRLQRSSLATAWQRMMTSAIAAGVIAEADRFGLHDLKRQGVTDTPGNRSDKQLASGHRSEAMLDVYDHSVPIVSTSEPGKIA